jgi:hypothetical protein
MCIMVSAPLLSGRAEKGCVKLGGAIRDQGYYFATYRPVEGLRGIRPAIRDIRGAVSPDGPFGDC